MPLPEFGNRIQETFTTTGLGTISLGGAVSGYAAFSTVLATGASCYYVANDAGMGGTHWEVGIGTYASGTDTVARTTILSSSNSGAAVNWAPGTKNIWLSAPVNFFDQTLYPEHFGASTTSTDNHAALQAWLSAGANSGIPLAIGQGTYQFQSALSISTVQNLAIQGVGKTQSVLEYTGSNTTNDIVTIGSSPDSVGLSLKGFGIISSTLMAMDSAALHLKYVTYSDIDIAIGTQSNANCYNGLWADFSGFLNLHSSEFYVGGSGAGDAVRANDRGDLHMNHSIIQGAKSSPTTFYYYGNAIHIGGNYGGVYTEQCDEIGYNVGLLVDTLISTGTVGNSEIYVGPDSTFDTNGSAAVYFDDANVSPGSVKRAYLDGWFETVKGPLGGNCLVVKHWNNGAGQPLGIVVSSVGKFGNADTPTPNGNGMVLDDTLVRYVLGPAVTISGNAKYGILSGNPVIVFGTPDFYNNGSGNSSAFPDPTLASYPFTASLTMMTGDVPLTNILNYFDGPQVTQPAATAAVPVGTWFVSGTVTMIDTAGAATFEAILWDGFTVFASAEVSCPVAGYVATISLSGVIVEPAANLRISVRDTASVHGFIKWNASGNGKDSTITAIRIAS